MVKFKVKRLTPTAKLPERTHRADTGYDIFADRVEDSTNKITVYTGLAVQPSPNYYLEVFPRSSIHKKNLTLANSVAIIDYDYRGEIILVFNKIPQYAVADSSPSLGYRSTIEVGEKIAQLVLRWRLDADWIEVDNLDTTERGTGGFGSTGK